MRALVALLVACSGPRPPTAVGNRAAPPPKPACNQLIWNRAAMIMRCTPGLFPTAGFYIVLAGGDHGIVGLDGTDLIPFAPRQPTANASVRDCATVDLDGDGVDEVVETLRRDPHEPLAGTATWLEVHRVRGRALGSLTGPFTSVAREDLGACRGDVRLAGRTIVVTVETVSGIPPSDCLAAGTHTFTLAHDAIVETR